MNVSVLLDSLHGICEGLELRKVGVQSFVNDLQGKTLIVFDTETTGLKPTPTNMVTELAAVAVDADTGKEIGRYHKKAKLTPEVRAALRSGEGDLGKLLRMTRYGSKTASYEPLRDVLAGFREFVLGQQNPVLIAHNAGFDMRQVNVGLQRVGEERLPKKIKTYDTAELTQAVLYPLLSALAEQDPAWKERVSGFFDDKGKFRFRLPVLGKVLGVPSSGWHEGLADTLQLAQIVGKILAIFREHQEVYAEPKLRKAAARLRGRKQFFKKLDDKKRRAALKAKKRSRGR